MKITFLLFLSLTYSSYSIERTYTYTKLKLSFLSQKCRDIFVSTSILNEKNFINQQTETYKFDHIEYYSVSWNIPKLTYEQARKIIWDICEHEKETKKIDIIPAIIDLK